MAYQQRLFTWSSFFLPLLLLFLFLHLGFNVVMAEDDVEPCMVKNNKTEAVYDLRPLIRNSGEDWKVDGLDTNSTFYVNVCRDILYDKTGLKDKYGIAVFQQLGDDNGHIVGRVDRTPYFRDDRLFVTFKDGDDCPGGGSYKRSSIFLFICDRTVGNDYGPKFLTESHNCTHFFEWRTPSACPTSGGSSGASEFFSILWKIFLIGGSVYFLGGILIKRIVLNEQGLDQIPHIDFWRKMWDVGKDALLMVFAKFYTPKVGGYGGGGGGGRGRGGGPRGYYRVGGEEENAFINEELGEE